jgi:hypothetical protein
MPFTSVAICSIVEGVLTSSQQQKFESVLHGIYNKHVENYQSSTVVWMNIPPAQAYLNREHSTVSTVLIPVPENIAPATRKAFLYEVLNAWTEINKCPRDKVVITLPNQSVADKFLSASRNRMSALNRFGYFAKLAFSVMSSKIRAKPINISINL